MSQKERLVPKQLEAIDNFSKLLDSRFRIPGTNIQFGLDFLIGLIPYGGDVITFLLSAGLVLTMARHGVSGQVIALMIFNIFLDTIIGSIPFLGDLFDLFYKANRRNYDLLEEHYVEGKYEGSIWKVIIPVLLALIGILFLMIWLSFKMIEWFVAFLIG